MGAWVDWNWKDNCGKNPFYLALSWAAWTVEIMVPQTGLDLIDKTNQVVYLGAGEVSGHHHNVASTREMLSTKFNELISCGTMKPKP